MGTSYIALKTLCQQKSENPLKYFIAAIFREMLYKVSTGSEL